MFRRTTTEIQESVEFTGKVRFSFTRYQRGYSDLKKKYHRDILNAKRESWYELVKSLRRDIWGRPYKIICVKISQKGLRLPTETIDKAIKDLFPTGSNPNRELINSAQTNIPPVNVHEVKTAAERTRKAPGPDRVPAEVLRTFTTRWPKLFADMVNEILKGGIFPPQWKTANLVLIPKPGKTDAYRPICLLNTTAKTVESIINNRLQEELESESRLSDSQFGFRAGRSTLMAIEKVMEQARKKQEKS